MKRHIRTRWFLVTLVSLVLLLLLLPACGTPGNDTTPSDGPLPPAQQFDIDTLRQADPASLTCAQLIYVARWYKSIGDQAQHNAEAAEKAAEDNHVAPGVTVYMLYERAAQAYAAQGQYAQVAAAKSCPIPSDLR